MSIQMFLLVWHLIEKHPTSLHRTLERLLSRMNPQMVEQIMPFGEDFPAIVVITREGAGNSTCGRVIEPCLRKLPRIWDVYLIIKSWQVDPLSDCAFYNCRHTQFKFRFNSFPDTCSQLLFPHFLIIWFLLLHWLLVSNLLTWVVCINEYLLGG